MLNLTLCELMKLKRSKMVYISLAASIFSPLMMFLIEYHTKFVQGKDADFLRLGLQTNKITALLIGTLLYGLITAHLFNIEFEEDTLKSLFTIPVNRIKLLCAKLLTLAIWMVALTAFTFLLIFLFAQMFHYENHNAESMVEIIKTLFYTTLLIYPLQFFVALVVLFFKGLFPAITFTITAQIIAFVLMRSHYLALFPWTIPTRLISTKMKIAEYSPELSVTILITSGIIALVASAIRLKRIEL